MLILGLTFVGGLIMGVMLCLGSMFALACYFLSKEAKTAS